MKNISFNVEKLKYNLLKYFFDNKYAIGILWRKWDFFIGNGGFSMGNRKIVYDVN